MTTFLLILTAYAALWAVAGLFERRSCKRPACLFLRDL